MIDVEAMVETVAQEMYPDFWTTDSQNNLIQREAARKEARSYVDKVLGLLPASRIEWSLTSPQYPGNWPVFTTQTEAQKLAVGNRASVVMRRVTGWVAPRANRVSTD